MKFQVGPRSDEAGRWTRLARLSRSTCRSSYPVCVSSFFHASNFARLFFLPRISLHRFSSISPLDIYLHFDHLTLQEDVPIATNPRNLFDSKRKKKRRDEKSGARTRRTNYELSYVSNNLLSRAFTVTLINSKKRLLISIYIYTLKNWWTAFARSPFLEAAAAARYVTVTRKPRVSQQAWRRVPHSASFHARPRSRKPVPFSRARRARARARGGHARDDGQAEVRWHGIPSGEKRHRSLTASLTGACTAREEDPGWCNGIVAGHARGQGPFGPRRSGNLSLEMMTMMISRT